MVQVKVVVFEVRRLFIHSAGLQAEIESKFRFHSRQTAVRHRHGNAEVTESATGDRTYTRSKHLQVRVWGGGDSCLGEELQRQSTTMRAARELGAESSGG